MKTAKILLLFFFIAALANAQTKNEKIADLEQVLKLSLYKSEVKIDNKGVLSRKDNNGNWFKYALADIHEVTTGFDGFHNLFISFKEGKNASTMVNGEKGEHHLNVFAFANQADCEKAKKLLTEIISKQ